MTLFFRYPRPVRALRKLRFGLIAFAVLIAPAPLLAARFTVDASNPGAISGTGRALSFDLSGIAGEIESAQLVLNLNYSNARELSVLLRDSGGVLLPIVPVGAILSSGKTMIGSYRITDTAVSTWELTSAGVTNIPPSIPVRAYQFGLGGLCTNLLGRYLEFDINRAQPVSLEINRAPSVNPGSGAINAAQLIIDTSSPDEVLASGFEESAIAMTRCRPPAFNVVLNSQEESLFRSNLTVVNATGAAAPLNWYFRDFVNPDIGPIAFGVGRNQIYIGRFGGRNRLNMGFWDASTGTVNFTTGAGGRTIELPGDWATTQHQVIPGDYDGDGVTDAAVAFLDSQTRWIARIRFSRSADVRDFLIDPRALVGAGFSSARIGLGAGQDADQNGVDEITLYAEVGAGTGSMRNIQFVLENQNVTAVFTSQWGALGDRQVLGKWINNSSGNQLGLMVVRPRTNPGSALWFLFPNGTPTPWGSEANDLPVSFNYDQNAINDIAVYRPNDQRLYLIESGTGALITLAPLGGSTGFNFPVGAVQGTTAPLEQ